MKKLLQLFSFLMILCSTVFLVGCETEETFEGQVKVTYNLEGGKYHESSLNFIHYYSYEEGEKHYISDPQSLSGKEVTKESYAFGGWYQTKEEIGGKIVYSNPWNFENDIVSGDELVLYAKWNKFTYNVGYMDENNNFINKGQYFVSEGEKFRDLKNYTRRNGYTLISYSDENGNPLDIATYTHPGDAKESVTIVCQYIKGVYSLVSTAGELKKSLDKNIYLLNDIDMGGDEFNFKNYSKHLMGNGHTISNIKVSYANGKNDLNVDFNDSTKKSLMISLFGYTNEAHIQDVNFENIHVDIKLSYSLTNKIYLAPIAVSMEKTTISNVSFKGTYTILNLPSEITEEDIIVSTDKVYYVKDENSEVINTKIEFVKKDN